MKPLEPHETELIAGRYDNDGPELRADENYRMFELANKRYSVNQPVWDRINWLIENKLVKVGIGKESGGWEHLFRDPADGRYWLLTYPFGALQGGGPPSLLCKQLTDTEIQAAFATPAEWDAQMTEFYRERNIRLINSDKKTMFEVNRLRPNEKELIGGWVEADAGLEADNACHRIHWLVTEALKFIGAAKNAESVVLYQDPQDGRYWCLEFTISSKTGGAAPILRNLTLSEASLRKRFVLSEKNKCLSDAPTRDRLRQIVAPEK